MVMLINSATAMANTTHNCDRYSATKANIKIAPSISLDQLIARLKATSAIGLFTKIALRSDIIALQNEITVSATPQTIHKLRRQFDGLVLKILALLDKDPDLARDIYQARKSIWQSLILQQQPHSITTHHRPRRTS